MSVNKFEKHHLRVLISTQDVVGGVKAMKSLIVSVLKQEGYDVSFIYPARSLRGLFSLRRIQISQNGDIENIKVNSIPYVLMIDHLVSAFIAKKLLNQYDIYQAVGGGNQPALLFMIGKKRYVCWVATTIKDEGKLIFDPLHPFEFSMRILLYYFNYLIMPLIYRYEKRIYQKAEKILTISQHTKKCIQEQYGIPDEKFCIIPFPIDTDKFKPIIDGQITKQNFILMVGRLTDPRKNIKLLLKSFVKIKQSFPDLRLILIGKKPKNNNLEKFCNSLGIGDSVDFPGQVSEDELIKYYNQVQLFVLPSLQEGLGIVVLESMACGTPVVSTKCGGPEEIIIHGENGYLVENNDVEALADSVCKLLADNELRMKMGEKAREFVCQNYSIDKIKENFTKVYKEVYPHLFDKKE